MGRALDRARDYREQAAQLLAMSERIVDLQQRIAVVDLATACHRMAEHLESFRCIDIKPRQH